MYNTGGLFAKPTIDGLHRRRCHRSDVLQVLAGLTSGCSTPLKNNNGIEMLNACSVAAERKLKAAMKKLTHEHGVNLDPQLHDDLTSVMNELTGEIQQKYPEDSFRHLFREQQLQALKTKDRRQVCWHPALIKWCVCT